MAVASRTAVNRALKPVVADVTTTLRERALATCVEVEPHPENGLTETSFVVCHELATVEREWLDPEPVGRLGMEAVFAMRTALAIVVGVADLPR